jgi:hypothetical protein
MRFREACSKLQAEFAAARLTVCSADGARVRLRPAACYMFLENALVICERR